LKTSTTLTSSSGWPCCSSPGSSCCSSSAWSCSTAFLLFSFYSHCTWVSIYIYKGKSNNKTQPSLTNICSWTKIGARSYRLVVFHFCTISLVRLRCFL
jgi:hypothetical protein